MGLCLYLWILHNSSFRGINFTFVDTLLDVNYSKFSFTLIGNSLHGSHLSLSSLPSLPVSRTVETLAPSRFPFFNFNKRTSFTPQNKHKRMATSTETPEIEVKIDATDEEGSERGRLMTEISYAGGFEGFHDEMAQSTGPVFTRLTQYGGGVTPAVEGEQQATAKLGTMLGVFLPCLQNIFGIMMFARLAWLTGNSGMVEMIAITVLCCSTVCFLFFYLCTDF